PKDFIGDPNYSHLGDLPNLSYPILDLFSADAIAAGLDDVARTPSEKNTAVFILITKISCKIVPVTQYRGGALFVLPIAKHNIGTAGSQLPYCPGRQAMTIFVSNDDFNIRDSAADRAELARQQLWIKISE